MKVKVHWVIDGIAEVEAESLEDAEKMVNEKLSDFVNSNPDIEKKMGAMYAAYTESILAAYS